MSTYINQIVQVTRRLVDATDATHTALMSERLELILAALGAGVDGDLITWAIGMNDTAAKIQVQHAIGHMAAAVALASAD
jgi:hypothetical protein